MFMYGTLASANFSFVGELVKRLETCEIREENNNVSPTPDHNTGKSKDHSKDHSVGKSKDHSAGKSKYLVNHRKKKYLHEGYNRDFHASQRREYDKRKGKDVNNSQRKDLIVSLNKDCNGAQSKELNDTPGKDLSDALGKDLNDALGKDLNDRQCKDLNVSHSKDVNNTLGKDLNDTQGKDLNDRQCKDLNGSHRNNLSDRHSKGLYDSQSKDLQDRLCKDLNKKIHNLTDYKSKDLKVSQSKGFNKKYIKAHSECKDLINSQCKDSQCKDSTESHCKDLKGKLCKDLIDSQCKDLKISEIPDHIDSTSKDLNESQIKDLDSNNKDSNDGQSKDLNDSKSKDLTESDIETLNNSNSQPHNDSSENSPNSSPNADNSKMGHSLLAFAGVCFYKTKCLLKTDDDMTSGREKVRVDESEPSYHEEAPFERRDVLVKKDKWVTDFYNVDSLLGKGKFGEVKRCKERRTGRQLAAKFIEVNGPQDRMDIMNEVEIMKSLQHPRLLQLYDAFENKQSFCLVIELVNGGELFERVINDDFILTERACVMFMRQICDGVSFMHSQSILHLDMKPENILCLTREGNRIKIIDFGLARKYSPKDDLRVLFGTPEFVAPEVVNFDPICPATDMWSVGVICYVLLSGLSPFMGESETETLSNVTMARWDFNAEEFENISSEAKDFITKLLVKDPRKRLKASECLDHQWLRRSVKREGNLLERSLSKKRLRKFVYRRKWQKAINAMLALRRMGVSLS